MKDIFFTSWENIAKVCIMTFFAYLAIIFLLRISGKRTLSKMNAFDFIVTVALGSILASTSLNKKIAISEGVTCFAILIVMQYIITWLSVRFKFVKNLITSKPILLHYKGELYEKVMKKERITLDEIYLTARKQGIDNLKDIDAIVLETTGDISIMKKVNDKTAQTMKGVETNNSEIK
ncbi:DUF421 domain-containing protein [Bernardetia sp.]|uniref:DUF421 domain-containing protein n=1 Tax=Bernardetia sp. TaxID=1937974 RepID=UPI0025C49062|nr:YetF domain-containing protein [Bernardetia sp.]